jgi:EAL domain-containing protein (putative c-di-GMP-specific phosphodiesterase class I)
MNIGIIAEGIETAEQVKMLAGLGCKHGQGFLYSKPLPAGEIIALLKKTH